MNKNKELRKILGLFVSTCLINAIFLILMVGMFMSLIAAGVTGGIHAVQQNPEILTYEMPEISEAVANKTVEFLLSKVNAILTLAFFLSFIRVMLKLILSRWKREPNTEPTAE